MTSRETGECKRNCVALDVPCPNRCVHWMKQDARRIGCTECKAEYAAAKATVAKVRASLGSAEWGYTITKSFSSKHVAEYWLVWSALLSRLSTGGILAYKDIVASGTTREAAEAAMRLLSL